MHTHTYRIIVQLSDMESSYSLISVSLKWDESDSESASESTSSSELSPSSSSLLGLPLEAMVTYLGGYDCNTQQIHLIDDGTMKYDISWSVKFYIRLGTI